MAPHSSFSRHPHDRRPASPQDNTALGSIPEGASGVAARSHQMLNPSPLLPTSDWLPMELTMPEYLRNVTGVEDLTQLKHLKIRVITRESSVQRIGLYAPNLLQLDLQGSCLGSLRDLGCGLVCLEVLSVSRCGLNSLDGTFGFPVLKELTASHNRIKDVAPCCAIENLRFLDLKGNLISSVERLGFLSVCTKLEELILTECPVTRERNYRLKTLKMLPALHVLDSFPADVSATSNTDSTSGVRDECPEELFSSSSEEDEGVGAGVRRSGTTFEIGAGLASEVPRVRRAASAVARMQSVAGGGSWASSTAAAGGARKKRPQTARPWRPIAGGEDFEDPSSFALADEAPSSLTSGITVCGNIAAALLSNRVMARRNKEKKRAEKGGPRRTPEAEAPTTPGVGEARGDILEASRRWREAYASFRERNREKWAKEDEEEEEEDRQENQEGASVPKGSALSRWEADSSRRY